MKKFSINCDFNGVSAPFTIYIGDPDPQHHPLHFQADWLSKNRGGTIPAEVMDSIERLYQLSKKNNVPFEDLCAYALEQDGGDGETSALPAPPMPEGSNGDARLETSAPAESTGDFGGMPVPPAPPVE